MMTEQEWLTTDDPQAMLRHLDVCGVFFPSCDKRKVRLFAGACARLDYPDKQWVADDKAPFSGFHVAIRWVGPRRKNLPQKADLLREIYGNPFKRIMLKSAYDEQYCTGRVDQIASNTGNGFMSSIVVDGFYDSFKHTVLVDDAWLTWNDHVIPNIAQLIYEDRDFAAMPLLADALEEAGCVDATILAHCRGQEPCPWCAGCGIMVGGRAYTMLPVPRLHNICGHCRGTGFRPTLHVRGCWAIDLFRGGPD